MEIAIPLFILGATYVISKHADSSPLQESFQSNGATSRLPNTNVPSANYPISSKSDLSNPTDPQFVRALPSANDETSTYLNQTVYQSSGQTSDVMPNCYSVDGNFLYNEAYVHNNMVPFTSKRPHGQLYNANMAESVMDSYTGAGSQRIEKREIAPLFKPEENIQLANGMESTSDFIQSRVNPAMKNNIVKPFESIRVGPGLNQGYGTTGSGGFNSGMEARDTWLPKTVDELRVATNPKDEYALTGLQGPAASNVKNVGIIGKVEKNHPDTFYIQSPDRWLTTTGMEKGPRVVSQEILPPSNRNDTTCPNFGVASAAGQQTASYVPATVGPPKRTELAYSDLAKTVPKLPPQSYASRDASSTNTNTTKRSQGSANTQYGAIKASVGAVFAPIMDIIAPTRKEDYVCNLRMFGNSNGEVGDRGYARMDTSGLAPTIRETTLHPTRGNISGQDERGEYTVPIAEQIYTHRATANEGMFNAAGSAYGLRSYDGSYQMPSSAAKEQTLNGRTNGGNMQLFSGQANPTTLRDDCAPTWYAGPNSVVNIGPSSQMVGKVNAPQELREVGIERIQPNILDAFKNNPYTFNLTYAP